MQTVDLGSERSDDEFHPMQVLPSVVAAGSCCKLELCFKTRISKERQSSLVSREKEKKRKKVKLNCLRTKLTAVPLMCSENVGPARHEQDLAILRSSAKDVREGLAAGVAMLCSGAEQQAARLEPSVRFPFRNSDNTSSAAHAG